MTDDSVPVAIYASPDWPTIMRLVVLLQDEGIAAWAVEHAEAALRAPQYLIPHQVFVFHDEVQSHAPAIAAAIAEVEREMSAEP
jgi:hypothetical protein